MTYVLYRPATHKFYAGVAGGEWVAEPRRAKAYDDHDADLARLKILADLAARGEKGALEKQSLNEDGTTSPI